MSNKQKNRNTNQFKKKKNKQKNHLKLNNSVMKDNGNLPPKLNIKYYSETQNFRDFIEKFEIQLESEKTFVEKFILNERDIQTTLWDGKWVINETVNAKCIRYNSYLYDLSFTPLKNGIQLFKISINPNFQRRGIGKELMGKILNIVEELNIEISLIPISFEKVISQKNITQFYKDLGFKKDLFSPYWRYNSNTNQQIESNNFSMVA
jgi:GNAT superfamily N-acetyltransferase